MMCIDQNITYFCGHGGYVKEKCHPQRADDLSSCPDYKGVKPVRPLKKCPGCSLNEKKSYLENVMTEDQDLGTEPDIE